MQKRRLKDLNWKPIGRIKTTFTIYGTHTGNLRCEWEFKENPETGGYCKTR